MKDNPPKDIQEISPSNFRINIINNNNNINNNINNNNKSFKEISELSSVVDDNKEKNKQIHPKRQMNNNIDLNFPNFSNNNFNNELNTNNTNEISVSPASTTNLKKLSKKSDILVIEIINSFSLDKNLKIEINPLGMIKGSKRNANDGFTYFGLIDEEDEENNNNEENKEKEKDKNKEVDFEINTNDINTSNDNSNIIGRHFRIRFDVNTMKYYIKDLGLGYGTFK